MTSSAAANTVLIDDYDTGLIFERDTNGSYIEFFQGAAQIWE